MKKPISIIAILIFFNLSNSQNINDNLLIYYPFSSNADDSSGNNFDGIPNATLTIDRFDNPNNAYSFNGQDEYIDFPNITELKPELPVSFSFWVKFDDMQPENTVLFTTDFAQDNHSGAWMNLSSTGFIAINYGDATGNTTSSNRRTKIGSTALSTALWYHILGIIKGPDDMEIFVDCNNVGGSYQGSGGNLGYTSNSGSIGRKDAHTSLPAYYLKGALDDFRYWNRELNLDEVNILCNNSSLSISEFQSTINKISIYPNPVKEVIQIKTNNIFESISIYNIIGEQVYNGQFNSIINVEHLKPGLYFLQVSSSSGNAQLIEKFIKK